jgi:hypothetical protein
LFICDFSERFFRHGKKSEVAGMKKERSCLISKRGGFSIFEFQGFTGFVAAVGVLSLS